MHLFRSEEHVRKYDRFDPATEDGIIPLRDAVKLFSIQYFRRRMDPDYFSSTKTYIKALRGEVRANDRIGVFMKS